MSAAVGLAHMVETRSPASSTTTGPGKRWRAIQREHEDASGKMDLTTPGMQVVTGRLDTSPRVEKYHIVKKDVVLRSYGVVAYGRHVAFVVKLRSVLRQQQWSETDEATLWRLLLEWAPWDKVFSGEVPFDGPGGLGERHDLGILEIRELQDRWMRFERLEVTDYKGFIFVKA